MPTASDARSCAWQYMSCAAPLTCFAIPLASAHLRVTGPRRPHSYRQMFLAVPLTRFSSMGDPVFVKPERGVSVELLSETLEEEEQRTKHSQSWRKRLSMRRPKETRSRRVAFSIIFRNAASAGIGNGLATF